MNKPRIFSGIQPSGNLHIGNYLGAIKNWVKLQDEFESIFCVVDLHAITVPQDPEELKKKTIEVAKAYLASGIDVSKSTIFIQSHVSEHAELAWILNTIAKTGELFKMTQFKDKAIKPLNNSPIINVEEGDTLELNQKIIKKFEEKGSITEEETKDIIADYALSHSSFGNSGVGLFDYPVLMAADILLYDAEKVPVGKDQFQHVELTRTLANRFNKKFGETFKIPEAYKTEEGKCIMGLDDPTKKMSKSAGSEYNYIGITDDTDAIRKKIKKAVTDSGSEIKYEEGKPALKNLINIYSSFSEKSPKEIVELYAGKGYADFKDGLAEEIVKGLKPIQEKMKSLSDEDVLKILKDGAKKVRPIAKAKLDEVKKKVGFIL
jgi:tryptophanyl-tRNA synthetase